MAKSHAAYYAATAVHKPSEAIELCNRIIQYLLNMLNEKSASCPSALDAFFLIF